MATSLGLLGDLSEDLRISGSTEYDGDLHQLQFVLENQAASAMFVEYSTATFSVENIRFLIAVYDTHRYLLDNLHKHPGLRREIKDSAKRMLYTNYIQVGAALEVNISDKTRREVMQYCEAHFPTLKSKAVDLPDGVGGEGSWRPLLGTIADIIELEGKNKAGKTAAARAKRNASASTSTRTAEPIPSTRPDSAITDSTSDSGGAPGAGGFAPVRRNSQVRKPPPRPMTTRSSSTTSEESRDEDDADEIIEMLRPAIVEVTNLILKDTWGRFRRSTYYERFHELFTASSPRLASRGAQAMVSDDERGRPASAYMNIVQIMNPNLFSDRSSIDEGPSPRVRTLSSAR